MCSEIKLQTIMLDYMHARLPVHACNDIIGFKHRITDPATNNDNT